MKESVMQPGQDTHQKSGSGSCLAKIFFFSYRKKFQLQKNQVGSYIYEEIIDNFVLFFESFS